MAFVDWVGFAGSMQRWMTLTQAMLPIPLHVSGIARHLERGQELDPMYPGTFMDMGQLLMQEGRPAEALLM